MPRLRARRFNLLLRGLWWRRGLTFAVLGIGVITTAAAALGPLYSRAASESVLHDHLSSAGPTQSGLHFHAITDITAETAVGDLEKEVPSPGSVTSYPTRIGGIYYGLKATAGKAVFQTALLWRQGFCDHVVLLSGHCPTAAGQALASARAVAGADYGITQGGTVSLPSLQALDAGDGGAPLTPTLTIVGSYRPKDTQDPFWFGKNYFDAHIGALDGPDTIDALLVDQSEFHSLASEVVGEIDIDFPLQISSVRLASAPALRRSVETLLAVHNPVSGAGLLLSTGLPAVLGGTRHERSLVNTGTQLVTLELGLLAWLVLFQVVADAAEARGNEIALAKLRGLSPARTIRFGLGETVLLLAIAIPIGLVVALVATKIFAASVLASGTPVTLTLAAFVATLVAFGGGVLAAGLAAQRTLTRPVLDQWRRTTSSAKRGRGLLVMDGLLAAAAVAGLVWLRRDAHGGQASDTTALLAPGLLVFAVALIGVRLLPLLCRALIPLTRASRWIALFLASRQVGRRVAGLRLAALLATALGLATFAVSGEGVASANRTARAHAELGAAQVASIQFDPQHDPVVAVDQADPDGKWAMAAATFLPDGGGSVIGTVLAVDSSRLAAVGYPSTAGPSTAQVAAKIAANSVPTVVVTSTQLRVSVTASNLSPGPTPVVQFDLGTAREPDIEVPAGSLQTGSRTYSAAVPCAAGCTFKGITWRRPAGYLDPQNGVAVISAVHQAAGGSWSDFGVRLRDPAAWRDGSPRGDATDRITITADGVQDVYRSTGGGYGTSAYAYVPLPLPVVATPNSVNPPYPSAPDPPIMEDINKAQATYRIVAEAPVLPVVLDNGMLVDLNYLRSQLPSFEGEARWSVWLGPKAPADAVARLKAAGLVVQSEASTSSRITRLSRQGPALSLVLLLACAVAGAVLAVGAVAISVAASGRRRSFELAALRVVGVSRGALLRANILEQLLLLGSAVVLGIPSGIVAARLTMPAIPLFSDTTPVPLTYPASLERVGLFGLAFVILLVATAIIAGRALLSTAVPARLRLANE